MTTSLPRLGLALSGGGLRAAAFHLGVLRYLAERSLLEQVNQISTVSGGSLIVGGIFAESNGSWPSSNRFLEAIFPSLRAMLVSGDLFSLRALGIGNTIRSNTDILFDRASILSRQLQNRWGIRLRLCDLPASPRWHINTTSFETGKNWRFSRESMGDWRFGTYYEPTVTVADAIAASAAVPYAIGALKLDLPAQGWWQTDPATKEPLRKIEPGLQKVRLWDGGAYENLALEPLFKPAEGLKGSDVLICADASAPLGRPASVLSSLLKGQLAGPRLFDIAADQIRSLRSRMLVSAIQRGEIKGFLLRLGSSARQFGFSGAKASEYLSDDESQTSLAYPTNLTRMPEDRFDLIARHGYEVAAMTIERHGDDKLFLPQAVADARLLMKT